MASGQLPAEVEEFATYLRALTRRLDAGAGWCGVFALRDPDGLRACLDGLEVPPWDLVQSLLQDLSAQHGPGAAQEAASRAAILYRASVAAHDAGPGRREALRDRLNGMLRQRRNAAQRAADLRSALSTAEGPAARNRLATELAWAHDDHQRATARTEELHARLAALPGVSRPALPPDAAVARPPGALASAAGPAWDGVGRAGHPQGAGFAVAYEGEGGGTAVAATGPGAAPLGHVAREPESVGPGGEPAAAGGDEPAQPSAASTVPAQQAPAPARPRPRGARFAGAGGEAAAVAPMPASPAPPSAESGTGGRATPRGARFAGAYEGEDGGKRRRRDRVADDGR
ncbi:hypothetical protein G4H13_42640, partial [Streptomyces rapamycinicus]|nr:hypothetical protein [Streptomyces rhizosphaericus]